MKTFKFDTFEDIIENIEVLNRPREYVLYIPYLLREMHPERFFLDSFGETRLVDVPYVKTKFLSDIPCENLVDNDDNKAILICPDNEKTIQVTFEGEYDV